MDEAGRRTPGATPRRRRPGALVAAAVAPLLLFELAAALGVETGLLPGVPRPDYGRERYWWSGHPFLGVWRRPNASFEHHSPCVDVRYRSNSVGARDVERTRAARGPRVVVLGDSFLDGWGVRDEERVSNLLEARTGIEHLNFAMPHFGLYQSLLAYRHLAKGFAHDAVLIGVLPANDFADGDPDLARAQPAYEYRYRPYLVGDAPPYEHRELREPAWRRALRRSSYAFNALLGGLARGRVGATPAPEPSPRSEAARGAPSSFYDYRESDARRLEWVLSALVRESEGRVVAVVLIPVLEDYQRQRISGPSPLAARLGALAEREGFRLVDLLATTAADGRRSQAYFHACDYHWNAHGNEVVAAQLFASLGPGFYASLATTSPAGRRPEASDPAGTDRPRGWRGSGDILPPP